MSSLFSFRGVGTKIAVVVSSSLFFVAAVFLLAFFFLEVRIDSVFSLTQFVLFFTLLLLFVEVVIVLQCVSYYIHRPLSRIASSMKQAEGGNYLVRVDLQTGDELEEMSRNFNAMMAKITDLDAKKLETERELVVIHEGLKYKSELETKAQLIETTNKKLEKTINDVSILYDASKKLASTLEMEELKNQITLILKDLLKIPEFSILLYNDKTSSLYFLIHQGLQDVVHFSQVISAGEGLCGKIFSDKKMVYIENRALFGATIYRKEELKKSGSFLGFPLLIGDRSIGVLNIGHPEKCAYSQEELKLFESLAQHVALAINHSQLYSKTKELSVRDELTGLYNRRHFQEVLHMEFKRAVRFHRTLSVLMIDVDYFKDFNDCFGHLFGDQVLKEIAQVLIKNVREVDTVARFGGEEFVILLADTDIDDAAFVAEKLRKKVSDVGHIFNRKNESPQVLTISVGISSYPEKARNEEELIGSADMALYGAKNKGRNRVVIFDGADENDVADVVLEETHRERLNS